MINVNSFQSLGAVDGPGIRFVVFLQGCNIKCRCCHNPETQSFEKAELYDVNDLFEKIERYKNYIKKDGGVTFSGGEPLLQAKELLPLFKLLKSSGYHIAVDTNGSVLNDDVKELMKYADLVLLDVKMPDEKLYYEYTCCHLEPVIDFLKYLNKEKKKVWIRQVVIEGINNTQSNIDFLNNLMINYNIEKIELLPFKKICIEKYKSLGMKFEMDNFKETDVSVVEKMKNELIKVCSLSENLL